MKLIETTLFIALAALFAFVAPACGDDDDGDSCTPDCAGLECGDDGCGGSCGACTGDDGCHEGVCDGCWEHYCGEDLEGCLGNDYCTDLMDCADGCNQDEACVAECIMDYAGAPFAEDLLMCVNANGCGWEW